VVDRETSDKSKESPNRKDSNSRSKFRLEGKTNPGYNDDVDNGILIKKLLILIRVNTFQFHVSFSFGFYY
jgi:hypothetical protein